MDNVKYRNHQDGLNKEYEAICRNCGVCCGAGNDPCSNLELREDGSYRCVDYANRLGPQKTIGGRMFNCVFIREVALRAGLQVGCAYAKYYNENG